MTTVTDKKIELVDPRVEDHLDEDKPIRGQKYVLLSFVSPEDVIINKEALFFSKFIESFSTNVKEIFGSIKEKYPETKDVIDSISDNHKYIFDAKEMDEQYKFFKSVKGQELEAKYHADNKGITSIRGVKVRGCFETIEEAKTRSEFLKKLGDKFHIYVGEVGCWCAWAPDPEFIKDVEYSNTQLNTLMKEYKQNMDDKDAVFESRKNSIIAASQQKVGETVGEPVGADTSSSQTPSDALNDEITDDTNVELASIKESIENVDVWSERKQEQK
jgi:hypothetical protein